MRIWLSYVLLFCLALSGLSGSVQMAHAYTLADAIQQQHSTAVVEAAAEADTEMPCHSLAKTPNSTATVTVTDSAHDCCDTPQHQCKGDCCAKHCAAGGALLAAELFRYIRPQTIANNNPAALPKWLFASEPPPPINA